MEINQEKITNEIQSELKNVSNKYKGEFDYMSEEERNKFSNVLVEMFMAGLNYGINKAKRLAE
jgi:molybdopterin converting factor small subunit